MPEPTTTTVHFEEHQRFTQWWIWLIVLIAAGLPMSIFLPALWQQLVLGEPWGNKPISNGGLIVLAIGVALTGLLPLLLLASSRLTTIVRDDGLFVRFRPFHFKLFRVDTESASSIKAVEYKPIAQYGGWGLRYRRDGKAYNVTGHQGIRIDYPNGKHLLIGSQQHEALADAVNAIRNEPPATDEASDQRV